MSFDTYSEIFAERAGAYHGAMVRWPNAREAEFRAVVESLAGRRGTLLDMPSGGGYLARYLPQGLDYVGVEPASDFLAAAPDGLERVHAEIADVPLPGGSAEGIVSLAGLHHEPDLGRVFAEMRRLLAPGGRLVIADVAAGTPPARFLNGFVDRNNPMGHDGRFLDSSTAPLLEGAGFAIVDDAIVDTHWRFERVEEAGAFGGQLFGTSRADAAAVTAALAEEIGFAAAPGGIGLGWTLRRIVCDAA